MPSLSLVTSVLDSHEAVRRQLLYLSQWLPTNCELIVVDDGSEPSLTPLFQAVSPSFALVWCPTRDKRRWSLPRGRNNGARLAAAEKILFFDIDHILTPQLISHAITFSGDRFHWRRQPAVLNEDGQLSTDPNILRDYGWDGNQCGPAQNQFVIRKDVFEKLGGYDEHFVGHYGGDDIDLSDRYGELVKSGKAQAATIESEGFVFPNPSANPKGIFHTMTRH